MFKVYKHTLLRVQANRILSLVPRCTHFTLGPTVCLTYNMTGINTIPIKVSHVLHWTLAGSVSRSLQCASNAHPGMLCLQYTQMTTDKLLSFLLSSTAPNSFARKNPLNDTKKRNIWWIPGLLYQLQTMFAFLYANIHGHKENSWIKRELPLFLFLSRIK